MNKKQASSPTDPPYPPHSFDEFWSQIRCVVYQVCLSLVGPDDAEDVCQHVAIRTFQRKTPFRDASHGQAWALTVATNFCRDLFRKRRRSRELSLDDDGWSETPAGRIALIDCKQRDPEAVLLAREQDQLVRTSIHMLPPRLRAVATLHFIDEHPHETVAATLRITPANVRKRIQIARALLRRAQGDRFAEALRQHESRCAEKPPATESDSTAIHKQSNDDV